ncbi:hypothetical protein JCM10213_000556 [Rhodosporidiobolus nylandii]
MPLASFLPSPTTLLKVCASTLAVLVGGSGTALYLLQNKLIYPANLPSGSRTDVPQPSDFGMPFEAVDLTTPDGVRLKAFLIKYEQGGTKAEERPTVLLLHANAGNVGHRLPIAKVFWQKMRCNVFALSYRGYGHSEGSPSEKGLKLDSQTALDYLLSHPELEKTPIFLYGQSIGGAVAIHLASQNAQRLKGLVIENTFMSLPLLIPHLMPFLTPFLPFLLHQIWPSSAYIATLPKDFPVLFLAGSKDELVEPGQMKGLWQACSSDKKEWQEYEHGTHNDTVAQPLYFHHIAQFPPPPAHAEPVSAAPRPSSPPPPVGFKPPSPAKSISSSSDGSAESFELVEREKEIETEGGQLETQDKLTAGSLGPKEELEELERKVEETVQELAEKGRDEL